MDTDRDTDCHTHVYYYSDTDNNSYADDNIYSNNNLYTDHDTYTYTNANTFTDGNMIIKRITQADIDFVAANLWRRGRRECEAFGCSIDDMRARFARLIGHEWGEAYYEYEGGDCCAMCILEKVKEKRVQTVFMATEKGFRRIWYPMTHHLKYKGDEMIKQGLEIEVHSMSEDTRAWKWYETMGFHHVSTQGKMNNYLKQGG